MQGVKCAKSLGSRFDNGGPFPKKLTDRSMLKLITKLIGNRNDKIGELRR